MIAAGGFFVDRDATFSPQNFRPKLLGQIKRQRGSK